ncbi:hypothetical protein OG455_22990 [Kitasatospora sp. NBC_01287]|uniref:hypothetical protein n=1 Tax=Kitasatospora sp. NBC_01287 TaxID=2903573 RepID=UPI00224E79B6|nr:hypothetical protein [Kitasatospora sp. NBC_01287]MCX4748346.1 hypothetical protein [Kitasatospora sp. NBC_01287]
MKLSKRTGVLLLAVGASAIAGQGAAAAAGAKPMTPTEVKAVEDQLATKSVPLRVPLGTVTGQAPMLDGLGGDVTGSLPASPVQPPTSIGQGAHEVVPDKVVPPLNFSKVGPSLDTNVPVPALADGVRPGTLGLDAPQAPLKAVGPAVGLGHPLNFVQGPDGGLKDGDLAPGDLDPRILPGAVSAVPGASASLGGPDKHTSVTQAAQNLLATTMAATDEAMGNDSQA